MLTSALIIGMKDLRQRLRDRSAIVMAIVAPLGLALILDATLGSAVETTKFEFAVLNEDGGELGAAFASVTAELEARDVATIVEVDDRAELDDLVDRSSSNAGFVVPAGFSDAIRSGAPGEITVVGDRSAPISVSVADAIATSFAAEVDYTSVAVGAVLTADPEGGEAAGGDPQPIVAAAQEVAAPISLIPVEQEGQGFDLTSYYAISLSIFFLFFTVQFGVLSLLDEREAGTLSRLLTAPMPPGAVVLGKLLSSFVLGVVSMTVMVIATSVLMGASWGNPLAVGVLIVVGVLTAVAVATLVGAVAKTAEQAGAYASMVAVVLGLLGGSFFPISQASNIVGSLSYLSPHRWLLDGFRDVSYGESFTALGRPLLALAVFIVVTGSIGMWAAARGVAQQ